MIERHCVGLPSIRQNRMTVRLLCYNIIIRDGRGLHESGTMHRINTEISAIQIINTNSITFI